jgi:signal transduction histidine kinase
MINPEELNLNELIMYNVDMGQTVAMNKNISLEYITSISDECTIVSDKAMINTVLRNLINNAIKYTPQNGNITVSLGKDDGMFRISVKDNGVGITEEIRKDLFRTNAIQSTPGTDNEKGTGLGLVLCRDFVNKLGGDIWVESVYGHGATFTFSLKNL